jgi:hypothetical protein
MRRSAGRNLYGLLLSSVFRCDAMQAYEGIDSDVSSIMKPICVRRGENRIGIAEVEELLGKRL